MTLADFDPASLTHEEQMAVISGELSPSDVGAIPEDIVLHSASSDLERVKKEALRIFKAEAIPSTERLIHLRSFVQMLETKFTDTELRQQLWTARRVLAGVIEPHKAGSRLLHSCAVRLRFYGKGL